MGVQAVTVTTAATSFRGDGEYLLQDDANCLPGDLIPAVASEDTGFVAKFFAPYQQTN